MKFKRYLKKCEEFSICSEIGNSAGICVVEPADERRTLYQIVIKGSGRMAKVFDSNFLEGDCKNKIMTDLRGFMGSDTIFQSYEPFHMYGFNTLDTHQDWEGKLIKESFMGENDSWLVCFDGNPTINDVLLSRMDYAKLENKWYNVDINNSVVGVFKKNG